MKGRIAGQERLVPDVYAEAAKPDAHRWAWREPSPSVRAEFRALSANPSRDICIAAIESAAAPPHEPILIKITGGRTIPTTIAVSPGTRLAFENRDPFPHKLYQVGSTIWKAEVMNPASRREWSAPPGAGRFRVPRRALPERAHRSSSSTRASSTWRIRGATARSRSSALPQGDYVLKAFFQGKPVGKPVGVTVKGPLLIDMKDPLNLAEASQ